MSRTGQQTSPAPTRHAELHRQIQPSARSSSSRNTASPLYPATSSSRRLESDRILALATSLTHPEHHHPHRDKARSSELTTTQRYRSKIRQLLRSSAK